MAGVAALRRCRFQSHPLALPPRRHAGQQSEEERHAGYEAGDRSRAAGGEGCVPSEEQGGVERNSAPDRDDADQVGRKE